MSLVDIVQVRRLGGQGEEKEGFGGTEKEEQELWMSIENVRERRGEREKEVRTMEEFISGKKTSRANGAFKDRIEH